MIFFLRCENDSDIMQKEDLCEALFYEKQVNQAEFFFFLKLVVAKATIEQMTTWHLIDFRDSKFSRPVIS